MIQYDANVIIKICWVFYISQYLSSFNFHTFPILIIYNPPRLFYLWPEFMKKVTRSKAKISQIQQKWASVFVKHTVLQIENTTLLILLQYKTSGAGGFTENIQLFTYRPAKPSKPLFFPKVAKSEANWRFSAQKKSV